ncbi:VTT domain-containing protein [Bifidobacterium sp. W8108]|uniref:DedA family protein n=1 Tax=unclassified Bifidobacterium TaxID=2608897 RepID=UPI0018DC2FCC|nr:MULTISPECIES: VTT domain-containing protein [unclassified Bifidobacterium]MBH9979029.1 VTT domain-containing protein [Bifidobacterium sp. W8108]MBI0173100.1 VTT domain-containing protein [Bifidobacterium sp. M0307]
MMQAINAWLLAAVSGGWGLWSLFLAAFLDALIIPIPTELVVLATATAFRAGGSPLPIWVILVCALAFTLGDVCTYWLGRLVPLRQIVFFRGAAGKAVISWAHRAFERGGGFFTVASRFVPAGRTIINLTAGAAHYPLSRYIPLSALAGGLWGIYMWTLGYLASAWLANNPLTVMALGFLVGMVVGFLCDMLMKTVSRHR